MVDIVNKISLLCNNAKYFNFRSVCGKWKPDTGTDSAESTVTDSTGADLITVLAHAQHSIK